MVWTAPATFTNVMLTAAQLNAQLSANLASLRNSNDQLVKLYLDGNETVTNNLNHLVNWDLVEGVQIGTIWTVSLPTRLTAPVTGYYEILTTLEWVKGNASGSRNCSIILNSPSMQTDLESLGASGGRSNLNGKLELLITAGNYITVQSYQNSGGTEYLHGGTPDRTRISMRLIGT